MQDLCLGDEVNGCTWMILEVFFNHRGTGGTQKGIPSVKLDLQQLLFGSWVALEAVKLN